MSKAFTKESDGADEGALDGAEEGGSDPLPRDAKNYMTPKGAKALQDEFDQLAKVERPKIVEVISWAAGNGDRSENADYLYGKRRLREIDRRLRYLGKRIDTLQVIDPASQKSDRILFGATVRVADEDGKELTYKIVGIDETEPNRGKISWVSPIGRALLQAQVGDGVTIRTPKGEVELEILQIEYHEID